jgi:hypothetical protein
VATLAIARRSLESACDALDDAVLALPEGHGDKVMVSPGLVALLLRVVAARRHLKGLEHVVPHDDVVGRIWAWAPP